MRKLREDEVAFSIATEFEHIAVRGNAIASGDDAEDKALEDEILKRLEDGDVWAWCCVKVSARYELPDGTTLTGVDYLGGCSYRNEAEFREPGGYFDDMKLRALEDLQVQISVAIEHGKALAKTFA